MKHKEPLLQNFLNLPITVETRYNEPIRRRPRYNDDLLYPSHDVIHFGKEPRYHDTLILRTNFASPLALRYIEIPLQSTITPEGKGKIRKKNQTLLECGREDQAAVISTHPLDLI